ncbi:RND superfamily putative drug exporter [Nocardia transvalensis]|uniref:RND superfamily putative drug exporter n=1 Tax=Nocardia transvalensis TaxID=37333 RepID=A0A7W9PHR5_9NOCA|nr:MMPL family transporter [Nocardia transvalensis]MBB5916372.1 RND superfamily putative drug exporter [Nocardia transvalensis]
MVATELSETAGPQAPAHRWGRSIARRRRLVLAVWVLLLVACGVAYPALQSRIVAPDFNPPEAEFLRAEQLTRQYFPQLGDEQSVVVFDSGALRADAPEFRQAVTRAVDGLRATAGVASVVSPFDGLGQISADRHTAFAVVGLRGAPPERAAVAARIQDDLRSARTAAVTAELTGFVAVQNDLAEVEKADLARAEAIGLPVALAIMVLALGALVAAAVPVGIGLAGILLAGGVLFVLSFLTDVDILMTSMASMIGLGIGIDYAMFVVSRFREELARLRVRDRRDPAVAEAVGIAMNTAGRTILASGVIVAVSVIALVLIEAKTYRGLALVVSISVVSTLAVAMILLPALLAELGPAVNRGALPERFRPASMRGEQVVAGRRQSGTGAEQGAAGGEPGVAHGNWYRWALAVMRRPLVFGGAVTIVLLFAAVPITRIEYGLNLGVAALGDRPAGHAAQVLSEKFPPGTMAPIQVVATGPGETSLSAEGVAQLDRFAAEVGKDDRVAGALTQRSGGAAMLIVLPKAPVDDPRSNQLVLDLRERAREMSDVRVSVGGPNGGYVDVAREIIGTVPYVVAFVLIASFLFLVAAFRSIVLPLKAIAMNLLVTGAALGLTVAVFQWGWGESVLGFHSAGYLQVFLPGMVFVILFGLSMDYEVFLIRRMRERWDAAGDRTDLGNRLAVAEGLEHTARPITAAAAIMVVIFGSFVTADVLELKQIGFALAVAVILDAVLVRMVLVPAFMRLLGPWNWWLPRSFSRRPGSTSGAAT